MEEEVKKAKKFVSAIKKGAKIVTFIFPLLPVILIIILVVVICSGFIYFLTVDAADWSSDPSYSSYTQNTKITENGVETDIDAILDEALQKNGFTDEEIEQIRKELEEKGYSGEKLDKEVRKKKIDLLGIEPSSDDYSNAEIVWLLNEDRYKKYLHDYTELEYLLNAEFVIQAPYISSLGDDNLNNGKIHYKRMLSDGSQIEMEYTSYSNFQNLVASCTSENDSEVFKKFTINDNGKIEMAYWQKDVATFETNDENAVPGEYDSRFQSSNTYTEFKCMTTEVATETTKIKKYNLPFAYLWDLLVISEDYDFVSGLAKLAYDTEIDVTVFDNKNENTTENIKKYKIQTKTAWELQNVYYDDDQEKDPFADFNVYHEDNNENFRIENGIEIPKDETINEDKYVKIVETKSSNNISINLTYGDTWLEKFTNKYNVTSTGTKYVNGGENTPQSDPIINKEENGQVKIINDGGVGELKTNDSGDVYILRSKTTEQQIDVSNTTSTYSYSTLAVKQLGNNDTIEKISPEGVLDENGNKISETFPSLFIDNEKARERILDCDGWLFKMMEMNSETSDMIDLTKYLINKALNDEIYDEVKDFDFSKYKMKSAIQGTGQLNAYNTMFTEDVFIEALESYYSKIQGTQLGNNFYNNFLVNAEEIYEVSVENNINPEMVVVVAKTENSYTTGSSGSYNYWGVAHGNHSSSGSSFSSLEEGIQALAQWWHKYTEDPNEISILTARADDRAAAGCDYLAYGEPGTYSWIQMRYSFLGIHEYGNEGVGGYYYMDPARAGVTTIYSTHEEFIQKCKNVHPEGTETTAYEQGQYTLFQVNQKIKVWQEIFGDYGSLERVEDNSNAESSSDFYENYKEEITSPTILNIVNFALAQVGKNWDAVEWTSNKAYKANWCAMFVSNAFNKYGLLDGTIPYSWTAAARGEMYGWQEHTKIPSPGDIITYCSGSGSHVGIVYAFDGINVYTVEGNCGDDYNTSICKIKKQVYNNAGIIDYIDTSKYLE